MIEDARDIPLDEFEQHLLDRLREARAAMIATPPGTTERPPRGAGSSRHRRVLAVLLAVFVAVTGAAAAAISLSGGSSPPVRLPGGTGVCPPVAFPYVADASTKLVYPPNYPGAVLATMRPTGCFASAQDARAAGYTVAPPPAGDTPLGGVYMGPAPAAVRRTCQAARTRIDRVVYCPSRLPAPWRTSNIGVPSCPSAGCSGSLLAISGSFTAPPSYVGSAAGIGDVAMWAVPTSWVFPRSRRAGPAYFRAGPAYLPAVYCAGSRAQLISHTTFRGHPAAWYRGSHCLNGNAASTLSWRIGRESYAIAADGPATLRRHVIEYIAAHLIAQRSR